MIAEMNEAFARSQRVGGDVQMWVYIDPTGAVANAIIKKTSGNLELDNAAMNIVRIMRFSPARNGNEAVDVWIEVPIKFKAG
jgi:protein TonB